MFMVIHKKIRRTLNEQKAQYIGCTLLIALSCALFVIINIMGANIILSMDTLKTQHNQEDASFILQETVKNLDSLQRKYNIDLEERFAADYPFNSGTILRILSSTRTVNRYAVIQGEELQKDTDILVDPGFAAAHDIRIGDRLDLFQNTFTVTGFVTTPDYIYPLKNENDILKNSDTFGIAVVTREAFENIGHGYLFYSVRGETAEFREHLSKENRIIKWIDRDNNMRIAFIEGDIQFIEPMREIIPSTILLLTVTLISVILWRLLKKEFKQIGVLYALGYRKQEILRHYLLIPLFMALAGGITGTAAGTYLASPVTIAAARFYHLPVLKLDLQPVYLVVSLSLPFLFLIPITSLVIMKALQLSPLALIRGDISSGKISRLEKAVTLNRLTFHNKFRIRDILRNIPRTVILFLGIVLASALLLMGLSMKDSIDYLMKHSFAETFQYEHHYAFNSFQTVRPEHGEILSSLPVTITENKQNVLVYGIQENSQFITLKDSFDNPVPVEGTVITRALADRLNIQAGDKFKAKNNLSSEIITLQVDGVADFYLGSFIFMPLAEFNTVFSLPSDSYLEIYSARPLEIEASSLLFSTNREEMAAGFQALLEPIHYIMGVIAAVAFIIGLVIVYVITNMVIEENRSTISLLKIIGYNIKDLYSLFLKTNTPFVLLGYLASIPLILSSLTVLYQTITAEMNISIPVILKNENYLLGFLFIYTTYQISKGLNRNKINRVDMAEILKQQD
ncbi:ABC transporter permease [Candidatus Contubernalis alkaliaceticus]|uniref:ABC transporter permease n=1 Tax=Candidatus Contubernalis alkaliaceticus TaxID=338645 RepID=UPI001F4C4EC5|nr:FtsX-like permease family protein [Candidatus Contubernalis alkalaceticus]UNC91168.1 FtsX-like permease family protein [Candidatus Contubernalis alkalaceticus]